MLAETSEQVAFLLHVDSCAICSAGASHREACAAGRVLHEVMVRQAHMSHYRAVGSELPEALA